VGLRSILCKFGRVAHIEEAWVNPNGGDERLGEEEDPMARLEGELNADVYAQFEQYDSFLVCLAAFHGRVTVHSSSPNSFAHGKVSVDEDGYFLPAVLKKRHAARSMYEAEQREIEAAKEVERLRQAQKEEQEREEWERVERERRRSGRPKKLASRKLVMCTI